MKEIFKDAFEVLLCAAAAAFGAAFGELVVKEIKRARKPKKVVRRRRARR